MRNLMTTGLLLLLSLGLVAGCGDKKPDDHKDGEKHTEGDGHDHDKDGGDHGHKGDKMALGKANAGAIAIEAFQFGKVAAGGEGVFELEIAKPVTAVRAWVGVESGAGSVKAKCAKEGDGYDAHLEVPKPLPEGSRLWVEVEAGGSKATTSFALK